MELKGIIIIAGLVLLLIIVLFKIFKILKSFFEPGEFISDKIKSRSDRKFDKSLFRFKQIHKRNPTHDELFRIIINVSHMTILMPGKTGHWKRQRVRKYLLEKNHIVKNYIMK
jgi:hypothetical protein